MRRTTRRVVALAAVLVVGAVGGAAVEWNGRQAHRGATAAPIQVRTATVARTDLSDSRTLPGTLGFGLPHSLKGTGEGMVTRLPKPGDRAARGKSLFWVDDRPVTVLFGDTPLFRKLDKPGLRGHDVTVLADNLEALGYDVGFRTTGRESTDGDGDEFTPALAAALKRWQDDTGLQATGSLDPGRATVLPGPVRVGTVQAGLGDPAEGEVLTYTATTKSVTVPVDATDVGGIGKGDRVGITLPDGKEVPGRVTALSTTVKGGTAQDEAAQNGPATVDVTVVPDRAADVRAMDSAAVQVRFTTLTRKGVLAVPVNALVALAEGGYALQRPGGTLIAVRTGMFAGGLVEVSGAGLAAGARVVTAS